MNPRLSALLAPLAASVAGWMLSGSPVPMGLTLLVLLASLAGGWVSTRLAGGEVARIVSPILISLAALWIETRLFQDGRALAIRAEMPWAFHGGLSLLWFAALVSAFRPPSGRTVPFEIGAYAGVGGGLIVLGASAATILYDFGPWEAHPVAALPLMIWCAHLIFAGMPPIRRIAWVVLPGCLALTAIIAGSSAAASGLRHVFIHEDEGSLELTTSRGPEIGSRGPLGDAASRKLPREANLKFRGEVAVRIRAHAPSLYRTWSEAPLYLRTSTLALFESDEVISPLRSGLWLYDGDDGREDQRIDLDPAGRLISNNDPSRRHTYFVDRLSLTHLPLISNAVAIHAPSVYEFADDWYQLSAADEIQLLQYNASIAADAPAGVRAADLKVPRTMEIPGVYLQMPPSPLSGKIRSISAAFPADDPLGAIRQFLASQTSYSLHFNTPDGSSPIEAFLFGHGRGHCEHYAAATVLMLRSLGIPSRIAYGFAGGIADPGQRLFAFRDSDFHAWAEVLTPDHQWKVFDTTPRVPTAASRVPSSQPLPLLEELPYHDLSEFDETRATSGADWSELLPLAVEWLSRNFFLASALGLGLIGLLSWRLGKGSKGAATHGAPGDVDRFTPPRTPGFLIALEAIATDAGIHRRSGQTWRELLQRISERVCPPPAAAEAVRYHYRTTYVGTPREEETESRLLEELQAWSRENRRD